jgi:hypothetical protein
MPQCTPTQHNNKGKKILIIKSECEPREMEVIFSKHTSVFQSTQAAVILRHRFGGL